MPIILILAVLSCVPGGAQQGTGEHDVNIGEAGDEQFLYEGAYRPENPGERAAHPFHQQHSFRWFANEWRMELPVFADRMNLVTFRALLERDMRLLIGDGFEARLRGQGDEGYDYSFVIPAEAVGPYERVEVRGAADPVYAVPPEGDRRELAWTVAGVRVQAVEAAPEGVEVAQRTRAPERGPEHFINIGVEGDEAVIIGGAHQREGYNPASRDAFFRWCSFRWFGNEWSVRVPVFAGRHNEITVRARPVRTVRLDIPGVLEGMFVMPGGGFQHRILLPADRLGERESIEIHGASVPPHVPGPDARDRRPLGVAIDWLRVRPIDEIPEDIMALQQLPEEREPDLPLPHRLRGTEMRPLVGDVDSYVMQARLMRCNVMTIGPMNGRHFTAFETRDGIAHPDMRPDYIPNLIEALHEWGIAAIGWLPFNVQDLRSADQCEAANKYPQWRMEYIEWDERSSEGQIGMCVVGSPWREMHAGILKEAAALGLDGVFFDGFYLGGIPHPSSPGCVCRWCRERFMEEEGLETPTRVDWNDDTFKRWVRWRNHKLLETARFFRDTMREANPGLHVTVNYNIWPFGNKDWDTAIPMWSTDEFGVSQHAYTGRLDLEWVMLGFKSRVSHDLNPAHSDIWRTSRPTWSYDDSVADRARHELTMRTFMLSGLTYGTTPWHGGHITPHEIGVRVHEAVRKRERFLGLDELRHVGVILSQNTHDFWGHIPGTSNLADYQDTILGAWLLLTENHVPFRFVFDNELEQGDLDDYAVLLAPNVACLSDEMAGRLAQFVDRGGRLVVTGKTGAYDEWGERRPANALEGMDGVVRLDGTPCLKWLRTREEGALRAVLEAVSTPEAPLVVDGPRSLAVNASWAPGREALWVHMLNVSAFYPLGDTGFRGLGEAPVYAGDAASDADIVQGGKVIRESTPAREVAVGAPGLGVRRAYLGVSGTPVERDEAGRFVVPEVDVHEVLVLELE